MHEAPSAVKARDADVRKVAATEVPVRRRVRDRMPKCQNPHGRVVTIGRSDLNAA
jgi:hypothetical protein